MATITEDFVSFETAKLLKEKGFDVPVKNYFSLNKDAILHNLDKKYGAKKNWNALEICISRPSQSIALKWLRKVHNILIGVNVLNENNKGNTDYSNPDRWWYFWEFTDTKGVYKEELQPDPLSNEYSTYEEAAEAAIKYCIEHLI